MAEPFLSEIKLVSFGFAPKGWAQCNGQLLPINQNQALFSLLGTTYGGDGRVNFALPNFRGRLPIHAGSGHTLGEAGGATTATIDKQTMPQHTHAVRATNQGGDTSAAAGNVLAELSSGYRGGTGSVTSLAVTSVTNAGGGQPHTNVMPYLVLNFVIALQGLFPSPH
jgi:microcystin-dependent protein